MFSPTSRLLFGAGLFLLITGSASAEAQLSRHPYPQMPTQQSVALLWRTVGGTIPIVRYGPAPGVLNNQVLPTQILVRLGPDVQGPPASPRLHSAPTGTYQYEASIFDLQPGTTYYYGVYDDDRLLAGGDAQHSFTTLPLSDSTASLRLWVVGDSGNGGAAQIAGFTAMQNFVAADGRPIDNYLHLGDMAYNVGLDREFSQNFFDIYTDLLRNTACWPTMGNHEGYTSSGVTQVGPYYDSYALPTEGESGGMASGTEAYYAFDIGPVHFVCLNSHDLPRVPTGDMARWLKADLELADADWLIAFWHHPPYTKGTHDSDTEVQLIEMRELIMPILESHGVDLVLGGHSHIYERSMLVDGAYATPTVIDGVVLDDGDGDPAGDGAYRKSEHLNPNEGTVAIVAGHGRSSTRFSGLSPIMRSIVTEVGSVIIDIDGGVLTGKMLNSLGVVRDEFQIVKQGQVEPEVVAFPWQPSGPEFRIGRSISGETKVAIFSVPPAPDAVIFYTLDGSVPTTASSIYTGELTVSETTRVRAFSQWRGGARTSWISESLPLDPWVSYQVYVSSGQDDGVQREDTSMQLDEENLELGGLDRILGLRFADVTIPPEAFIVRAQVQFEKVFASFGLTNGAIWGELSLDSAALGLQPNDFGSRTKTASMVDWRPSGWSLRNVRDYQSESPDLRSILTEVIQQPGWQSGNAVSFFFTQAVGRPARAYESGPAKAASFFVTYIDPAGLTERLASERLEITPAVGAGQQAMVAFRFPVQVAADALGLWYQLEGSADLATWQPIAPQSVVASFADLAGYRKITLGIDQDIFQGRDQFYVRLRVSINPPEP